MAKSQVLSLAVVLYPDNALLDFQGPMELLETAGTNCASGAFFESLPDFPRPKVNFTPEYVAETREPIRGLAGPSIIATKTFSEVNSKQFDIILIPGGTVKPEDMPQSVVEFVRAQVPRAQYVLTVCTGGWLLAALGLLDGKRATSNKFFFNEIKKTTSPTVQWIAKARWVVDGKFWTASGVSAAQDMAYDFLQKLAGPEFAIAVKGVVGLRATGAGDDELADVFKLT
ncbi:unnamed protein product [Rhizoctonia solani]|uniref:DJ-1/PfpI domain-containing protein n=3 Tax=Rhizoctonia solani TaxID=456999 RepID=A0A8H3CS88_9AGAM|nr:unnamed protein product [Rhizoctonia solani]CAE6498747.1 unnamed protein product [Rhizoctonia solani]